MRCAGRALSARTVIFDVEPLVAYRDGGQEAGGSSCRAAAGGYLRRLVRPLLYAAAPAPQRARDRTGPAVPASPHRSPR